MSAVGNRSLACCAIAVGLLIILALPLKADVAPQAGARGTAGADTDRGSRSQATVELVAPAGLDLAIRADQAIHDGRAREMRLAGRVALTWKNGLQLRAGRARIALDSAQGQAPSRIFLEPLLAAPVELRVPEGAEPKRVVADRLYVNDSPHTLRMEDNATIDWANGFHLRAAHARVTLVETRPRRWGRVLIEPLPAAPAAP